MQSWITDTWIAGRYTTVNELTAEQLALAEAVQGLDQDNIASLTAAKVAVYAWANPLWEDRSVVQTSELFDDTATLFWIPNNAGTPWLLDFECGDGMLEGTLSITFVTADLFVIPTASLVWVGVKLDGALVAISPSGGGLTEDSLEVEVVVPIGAGSHRLEFVFGLNGPSSGALVVTWNGGTFAGEVVSR